ncbi:MAG: hypothetical protein JWP95_2380, partial [Actinotalea sp.]|nr:hypothetical protein [Actinotalea sp.]
MVIRLESGFTNVISAVRRLRLKSTF